MPFDNSVPQVVLDETVIAAIQQAVQQAVHQAMMAFAVPTIPTQPISHPTEPQSIPQPAVQSIPQPINDPRIAREKSRKREQRKRKRSSARKATQTAETQTTEHRETVSQPHQGTTAYETTSYKASGHETASTMDTTWSTAASLDHANKDQEEDFRVGKGLHGWMFRDSG